MDAEIIIAVPLSKRRSAIAMLAAVAAGMLAGCGQTAASAHGRTLFVAVTDYRVMPQRAVVSAGSVTILVHNYGRVTHNLAVSSGGQTTDTTTPIWPGGSAEMTVSLSPGTYLLASSLLSDQALGAYGTLKVS